jgi:hypothetical protein
MLPGKLSQVGFGDLAATAVVPADEQNAGISGHEGFPFNQAATGRSASAKRTARNYPSSTVSSPAMAVGRAVPVAAPHFRTWEIFYGQIVKI